VFRCDRCDRVLPEEDLIYQDGAEVCRTLCADNMSPSELDERLAEEMGTVDSMEPVESPVTAPTDGASAITAFSARPVALTDGGGAVTLTLTGVNLSSSVTLAYEDAGITGANRSDSSTSISIDLSASGVAAGDYWIKIDDHVYRGAIRVR
jgi:hypothetical protein